MKPILMLWVPYLFLLSSAAALSEPQSSSQKHGELRVFHSQDWGIEFSYPSSLDIKVIDIKRDRPGRDIEGAWLDDCSPLDSKCFGQITLQRRKRPDDENEETKAFRTKCPSKITVALEHSNYAQGASSADFVDLGICGYPSKRGMIAMGCISANTQKLYGDHFLGLRSEYSFRNHCPEDEPSGLTGGYRVFLNYQNALSVGIDVQPYYDLVDEFEQVVRSFKFLKGKTGTTISSKKSR